MRNFPYSVSVQRLLVPGSSTAIGEIEVEVMEDGVDVIREAQVESQIEGEEVVATRINESKIAIMGR